MIFTSRTYAVIGTSLVVVGLSSAPQTLLATQSKCAQAMIKDEKKFAISEFPLDTMEYLKGYREMETRGIVFKRRLPEFDTDFYYTGTGLPDLKGEVPLIDPKARAIFINVHGSGTKASGGKNAQHILSELANHGFAGVSFDLPYHAAGPRGEAILQRDEFMRWIEKIVNYFKQFKKPVYLMGHSFGPSVILEYLSRNPGAVDGLVALSPAGFTKELEEWFKENTLRITKAKWGETMEVSPEGSFFTEVMSKKFTYSTGRRADPTVLRPNTKVIIVSGDEEEFFPSILDAEGMPIGKTIFDLPKAVAGFMQNARVEILRDVGHRVFEPKHPVGISMIMAFLLEVSGFEPEDSKSLQDEFHRRAQQVTNSTLEGSLEAYVKNPLFRAFADYHYGKGSVLRYVKTEDEVTLERLWKFFNDAIGAKEKQISQEIRQTETTWPEFYAKFSGAIKASSRSLKSMFGTYYTALVEKKAAEEKSDKK